MNEANLVIDTNIIFAALLRQSTSLRRLFLTDNFHAFYCPRFCLVELFKHKERIARASQLTEDDLLTCFHELISRIHFVEEGAMPLGTWMEARRLCREIDPKDTPFIALTLHLDGRLWTTDHELITELHAQGFDRFYVT